MTDKQTNPWIPVAALAISLVGYTEMRLGAFRESIDLTDRVTNLERLMYPLLVQIRLSDQEGPRVYETPATEAPLAPMPRMEAEQWAEQEIQRAAPEFRKEQFLHPREAP